MKDPVILDLNKYLEAQSLSLQEELEMEIGIQDKVEMMLADSYIGGCVHDLVFDTLINNDEFVCKLFDIIAQVASIQSANHMRLDDAVFTCNLVNDMIKSAEKAIRPIVENK